MRSYKQVDYLGLLSKYGHLYSMILNELCQKQKYIVIFHYSSPKPNRT